MGYGIDSWMVVWKPGKRRRIKVAPLSDHGCSDRYPSSSGCCYADRRKGPLANKVMKMFIDFHTLVVRDGIDPQAAHREFLKIDEYRKRISPDTPRADK
jgi:hypothetical protein